jgi:alkyl hydroperoxide reductase subunit F
MYDVIIVGGGSASFSAAIYTARKLLKTLIVTKKFGGQTAMSSEVENYPGFQKISGIELIMKMRDHAESLGVGVYDGQEVKKINIISDKKFEIVTDKKTYLTKSVIIASGKKPRMLNIPGEKEFSGKGVAYCVTCDAPMFANKEVAVIGGGNSGLDAALELTKYAKKIYILEYADVLKGDEKTQQILRNNKKVQIITHAQITHIKGDKFVDQIIYQDKSSQKINHLNVRGVFVEIGWETISDFVPREIKKNKFNEIVIDHKDQSTTVKGIYAAGDVTDGLYKQTIVACGDAAKAALSVGEYLK